MKSYRIADVSVVEYPVLRIRYEDGFEEMMDFTGRLEAGTIYAPLRDPALFADVTVGEAGRFFGWQLDQIGQEIDFCADSVRFDLETQRVAALAETYRQRLTAAE